MEPNKYLASIPLKIEIPKRGFTLRPGVVPTISDRMIYQGIADVLAPMFRSEEIVYSNRLSDPNDKNMFVPGVELWIEFQKEIEKNCGCYSYVVETDLTAYFDHINHDILFSRIKDLFQPEIEPEQVNNIQKFLGKQLTKWSCVGFRKFGIPQINDASSFFANLYLDELDKWLITKKFVALRYVDDIRIFSKSEADARKALIDLIEKLQTMGLYVASGKTKIRTSGEVLRELHEGRDQISNIEDEIRTLLPEKLNKAAGLLVDYFKYLISDPTKFNDRHFRYCVNRFKKLHVSEIDYEVQDIVIDEILKRLYQMPEATDIFIDYLSLFPDNEKIQTLVLDFLESEYSIYDWQNMLLLELLIRSNISSQNLTRVIQFSNFIISSSCHPSVRAKAYLLYGKNGTYANRRDIRDKYSYEEREDIHRAIVFSLQEMQERERNYFYSQINGESTRLDWTVNYVNSLSNPTYHYFNPPSPYIPIHEEIDSDDFDDLGSEYFL